MKTTKASESANIHVTLTHREAVSGERTGLSDHHREAAVKAWSGDDPQPPSLKVEAGSYSFFANSPLVSQITSRSNSTVRMTTTKQYDFLNRLLAISNLPSADSAISFNYVCNDANQRVRRTDYDSSYWIYKYDSLGQLTSGKNYWSDGTPVAGQQFEYGFDDIGNRTATKAGGDETGAALRFASYTANSLNQYTSRTVPGTNDIIGIAKTTATVSVNGQSPYRKGEYYQKALSIANSATNVYQSVTNQAILANTTNTTIGNMFLPTTPETFGYDADGNQISDGRWFFSWDGENRLVSMVSSNVVDAGKRKLDFAYDWKGRRVRKTVSNWNSGTWQISADVTFVYDGWNLLAELNATNNGVIRSFVWGLDLSGTMSDAGGVSGCLGINSTGNGFHFAECDGNGNICGMVNATNGIGSAQYEYGAFGSLIRATGPMSILNPFRWSTKYQDDETDLAMYMGRPYSSIVGRFLTRDPIWEAGGINLYGFVRNNPINEIDPLGLCKIKIRCNPLPELPSAWHCGVVAPNGQVYEIGAVGIGGSSGGTAVVMHGESTPPGYKDYPVSCLCISCQSIQSCISDYSEYTIPPTYFALGPNSNTYAHKMLDHCGCQVDQIPIDCYTVYNSPRQGGTRTICPDSTQTPPGAVAWNYGF